MSSSSPAPQRITVSCETCDREMSVPAKHAGRKVRCPDCGSMNAIPFLPVNPDAADGDGLADDMLSDEQRQALRRDAARQQLDIKLAEPPKSLFFSHVFDFPWRTRSALFHWIKLTLLMLGPALSIAVDLWLFSELGGRSLLPIGFLFMAELAVSAVSFSYAANTAGRILQETSAGADAVEDWMDGEWRDWALEMMVLGYAIALSGLLSYLLSQPIVMAIGFNPVLLLQGLIFPVMWMSVLDADFVLLPWSPMVLRSLVQIPRQWLLFLLLANVLSFSAIGLLVGIGYWNPWVSCALLPAVSSTLVFIYARLLGRLAWFMSEEASRRQIEADTSAARHADENAD